MSAATASGEEIVVKGGRVIDATGERVADVLLRGGHVVEVGPGLSGARVLDAGGCIVVPGLVDLHTHLREPGMEEAETIETGTRAAALGGYTAVVAMPNTEPPLDDPAVFAAVRAAGEHAACEVVPAGCITKGRAGAELAPMGELYARGARIFTDDGSCVAHAGVMRRALEYSRALSGAVIAQHAEDPALADGGSMHEGEWSSRLGIPGRPSVAETVVVARDLLLAELTGAHVHFLHVSAAGAVELVRAAKARGLRVTAEAAPHHFTLTDAACASFDPVFKVHPPLRSAADVEAVKRGLADGTIDAIATDHAPHPTEAKERPFEEAPPGMLGLETAVALTLAELVEPGVLSLAQALALLSWRPAAIAGIAPRHGGPIAAGAPANLCVLDPALAWEVDPSRLASKARNTPYAGRKLTGKVRHTIRAGVPVVVDGELRRVTAPRGEEAVLVLADGTVFEGEPIGHAPEQPAAGELVFNTALSGYQEILTDPSYAGQVITFTYPHIGNYGVNADDDESRRPFCRGVVVRDLARRASSWRAEEGLDAFLRRHRVAGIAAIDTRRLTRHLRDAGAMPGAFGDDEDAVRRAAAAARPTDGVDLVAEVTTREAYAVGDAPGRFSVVAYDFGIKRTILRHLVRVGCRVEVVPASTPAADVLARRPDGVFLSNGPGDPAAVAGAVETVRALLGEVPVFGICLGHQIMGLSLGATTAKLPFGHHGANHPVRHEATGRVEITSQNHNYVVLADTIPGGADVTHVNLNDGTVEGLRVRGIPAFSVQHHPEAGPGPHESAYLFDEFTTLMESV